MAISDTQRFRDTLSACSRAFKAAATGRMRALGVHPGQNFLLEALRGEASLTTGELARRMHVEVPTAVRMIQRMEAAGLLAAAPAIRPTAGGYASRSRPKDVRQPRPSRVCSTASPKRRCVA